MCRLFYYGLKVMFFTIFFLNFLDILQNKEKFVKVVEGNIGMANMIYMQMNGKNLLNISGLESLDKELFANHYAFIGIIISLLFLLHCNLFGMLLPFVFFFQKVILENLLNILQDPSGNHLKNSLKIMVECFALFSIVMTLIGIKMRKKKRC